MEDSSGAQSAALDLGFQHPLGSRAVRPRCSACAPHSGWFLRGQGGAEKGEMALGRPEVLALVHPSLWASEETQRDPMACEEEFQTERNFFLLVRFLDFTSR